MLETNELLHEQVIQCNALAASAVDENTREFWLLAARRCLELLHAGQRGYGPLPEHTLAILKPVERGDR